MWSTSPFDRTVIVPPFFAPEVTSVWLAPWTPLVALAPPPPQPAATRARAPAAMPTTTAVRRLIPPPACRRPWIECVADSVPEQVEREHRQEQRASREREVPPRGVVDGRCLGQHLPPARPGRRDADSEERQRCFEQDVLRNDQRRVDDDRRDEVGEKLAEDDGAAARAARPRGLDELLLAQRENLAADDAADVRPVDDDDGDDHRPQTRMDEPGRATVPERARGGDTESEEQNRERERDVDEPRDDGVDPAAEIPGGHPENDTDRDRDGGRQKRDLERHLCSVEHAREDVAPNLVDPEEEARGWACRRPEDVELVRVLRVRRMPERRGDRPGEHRDEDEQQDEDERDDCDAISLEPHPEELPRGPAEDLDGDEIGCAFALELFLLADGAHLSGVHFRADTSRKRAFTNRKQVSPARGGAGSVLSRWRTGYGPLPRRRGRPRVARPAGRCVGRASAECASP